MENLHFFVFSNGTYSDYQVGGLYVADHPIEEEDWDEFVKFHSKEKQRLYSLIPKINETSLRLHINHNTKEYKAWREYLNVSGAFIEKHSLKAVPYQELWEY